MWRVGSKVLLNVYDGDRPVCQCHNEEDARDIVQAMNKWLTELREELTSLKGQRNES